MAPVYWNPQILLGSCIFFGLYCFLPSWCSELGINKGKGYYLHPSPWLVSLKQPHTHTLWIVSLLNSPQLSPSEYVICFCFVVPDFPRILVPKTHEVSYMLGFFKMMTKDFSHCKSHWLAHSKHDVSVMPSLPSTKVPYDRGPYSSSASGKQCNLCSFVTKPQYGRVDHCFHS